MQVPHMLQLITEILSQIYNTVILTIMWFLAKPDDTPVLNHFLKQQELTKQPVQLEDLL
jgi:hypothetical protein